jgi:nitrate reductase alpha subunit
VNEDEIGGRLVMTVFDLLLAQYGAYRGGGRQALLLRRRVAALHPGWAQEITSVPARLIARIGREFARHTAGKPGRALS